MYKYIEERFKFKKILIDYINTYLKEYILVILIFITGLFIGVLFVNNATEEKGEIITNYITEFMQKFKQIENINSNELMKESFKNNFTLAILLWLAGTTIIGMPVVLGLILYRGFCLGYTISAITLSLGMKESISFCLLGLFLQNILFIPAILSIGVSSINLYKSIIKDKRKENIKLGIIRHTIISSIMLGILLLSSIIENKISINLLRFFIK